MPHHGTELCPIASESFLILPHPEVLDYLRRKTEDYDRWLGGMARLKQKFEGKQ